MSDALTTPRLFPLAQTEMCSDDYYTPPWVFRTMALEFDLDVCAPPGGVHWIPAAKYYTQYDDGLTAPWDGRVWMNPPYSEPSPWVARFIRHGHGVCLLPIVKSAWVQEIWTTADGVAVPDEFFKFYRDGKFKDIMFGCFFAAFGDECVDAISRLGVVRRIS